MSYTKHRLSRCKQLSDKCCYVVTDAYYESIMKHIMLCVLENAFLISLMQDIHTTNTKISKAMSLASDFYSS